MSNQEINAELRTGRGKGDARKLRRAGQVPANLYGRGEDATALTIDPLDVENLRRGPLGMNTPLDLIVDGLAGRRLVMVKELQRHPVSRRLLHVDFLQVEADQPVQVAIKVLATGRSVGEQAGGRINLMRRKVMVRCLPDVIPEHIEVDVTPLDIGDKRFVDELVMPEGVAAVFDQRYPVLAISTKGARGIDADIEEEEEGEEGAETPEGAEAPESGE